VWASRRGQVGATKEQVAEVILQTIFYAGGAAVANARGVAHEVFEAKAKKRTVKGRLLR